MIQGLDPRINDKLVQFLRDLYKAWPALQKIVKDYPRVANKLDRLNGPGVNNSPGSISISPPSGGGRSAPVALTSSLSTGQYQYMDYTMVSQNVAGWDFERLHNLI